MKFACPAVFAVVWSAVFAFAVVGPARSQDDMSGESTASEVAAVAVEEAQAPADAYADGADAEGFEDFNARVSYALGANIGAGMAQEFEKIGFPLDLDAFVEAFRASANGEDARLTTQQVEGTLLDFQRQMQVAQFERMQKEAEENTLAAEAFFEQNKDAEGVQTTESGLQYAVTKAGDGPTPGPEDTVLIHYEGRLLDGTVFDSSMADGGEPVPFPVNHPYIIEGFREGLQLLPVGSEGTLFIPGGLAYGMSPREDGEIGLNEMLIFDIKVLELVEDDAQADAAAGETSDAAEVVEAEAEAAVDDREPLAD